MPDDAAECGFTLQDLADEIRAARGDLDKARQDLAAVERKLELLSSLWTEFAGSKAPA